MRAQFFGARLVLFGEARGQHHNFNARQFGIRMHSAQHVIAVQIRHLDIKDQRVRHMQLQEFQRLNAIARVEHLIVRVHERLMQRLSYRDGVISHYHSAWARLRLHGRRAKRVAYPVRRGVRPLCIPRRACSPFGERSLFGERVIIIMRGNLPRPALSPPVVPPQQLQQIKHQQHVIRAINGRASDAGTLQVRRQGLDNQRRISNHLINLDARTLGRASVSARRRFLFPLIGGQRQIDRRARWVLSPREAVGPQGRIQ